MYFDEKGFIKPVKITDTGVGKYELKWPGGAPPKGGLPIAIIFDMTPACPAIIFLYALKHIMAWFESRNTYLLAFKLHPFLPCKGKVRKGVNAIMQKR